MCVMDLELTSPAILSMMSAPHIVIVIIVIKLIYVAPDCILRFQQLHIYSNLYKYEIYFWRPL